MDDATRHPDDDVLFDMVEGSLEPDRVQQVERHLSRCAACAAFVAAARSGREAARSARVELPRERADELALALRAAWRERREGVLAQERATEPEAETAAIGGQEPTEVLEAIPTTTALPRTRRGRRLLPILAFGVLATLAGTSVYVGEERAVPERAITEEGATVGDGAPESGGSASEDGAASEDSGRGVQGATSSAPAGDGPIEGDPTGSVPPVPPGDPSDATAELGTGAVEDDAGGRPSSRAETDGGADTAEDGSATALDGSEAGEVAESTCIATLDEGALVLPDGRIAQQVLRGPLGLHLVCG